MTYLRSGTYTGVRCRMRCALRTCRLGRCLIRHTWSCQAVLAGTGIAACPQQAPVRPGARVPPLRRASPCQSAPGSPSGDFLNRRSRLRITAGFTYDKCSAYFLTITEWRVDNYSLFLYAQGVGCVLPGEGVVVRIALPHDPQHFHTAHTGYAAFCTSNPHSRAQQPRAARTYQGRAGGLRPSTAC